MPAPIITVVGSANADLHLAVAQLPAPGETVVAEGSRWLPGGKGANQASAAARLGAAVRFIGAVGSDAAATIALGGLADLDVDVSTVRRVDAPTGVAVVCVDGAGENLIVVAAGANDGLRPDDVELPDGCDAVLVSLEIPPAVASAAVAAAKRAGALAVLNTAPADRAGPELVAAADIVVANASEADVLAGGRPIAALAAEAGTTLVVTGGPTGARAVTPDGVELHVPAHPAEVVDTVGAGDCFAAALTVALAEGEALEAAVRFAVVAGSLKVGRVGARSTPTRAEVDRNTTAT